MLNRSTICVYFLAALALPWNASAQISPSGGTIPIVSMGVRGSTVAYDSKNNVYLAVGAYGSVAGRFVRPDGTFASDPFQISTTGAFAHYPRVAFSPDANGGQGAFLVVWHENSGTSNFVHARLVSVSSGLLGTELTLGFEPTWWEAAPAVAYSTVSQSFLVVWQLTSYRIRGARVSAAGGLIDGTNLVVTDGFDGGGERDPSIAYNPATNQYLVAYTGWASVGAHAAARLVSAATGAMTAPQYLSTGTGTYISDASFSPSAGQYFVAWYQLPNGAVLGRTVDANGTPTGSVTPLSSRFGTYDSLGLAYNPVSGTHLMVGHDLLSAENGAVEISGAGVPGSAGVMTNAGGSVGNFYPKVASHTTSKQWMLSTAHDFARLDGQRIVSGSSGGGGTPPPSGPAPLQITSFSSNVALPTSQGTSITWTVNSSGGTTPIHYQFWRYSTTTGWVVGQNYSTSNTFTWAPPAGTNAVQVWARSAGSTAAYEAYTGSGEFTITGGAAQITSLTANATFPVAFGVPVTWTATASGGTTPHHFRFWRYSTATGWVLAQDYSTNNTFTWSPPAGTNAIQVWVRSAGSTASYEGWSGSGSFSVGASGPAKLSDLRANVSFPASPTSTITWTATASGSGTVEYKFWGYSSATNSWFVVRGWEPNNQASWTPGAAGQFAVQVWVRNVGSSATFEDWRGTSYFSLTSSTSLTLGADRSLTSLRNNNTVTFTAQVTGGTGAWEYQFWTYNGTAWTIAQPYPSGQNTFTWVVSTGTRAVQVWIRSAGSNHTWERWAGTGVFIVNP